MSQDPKWAAQREILEFKMAATPFRTALLVAVLGGQMAKTGQVNLKAAQKIVEDTCAALG